MNEKYIKLSDTEEGCDFDIDISNQYAVIDAKSILGVMALGMGQPLAVTYGGKNRGFEHVLSKYTVV